MPPVLQYGMEFILFVQQARNPVLDFLFTFITYLGGEVFYLLFIPILYWCIDKAWATRIGFLVLISGWLNFDLKDFFHQPRPFVYLPDVQIGHATGWSLPSGHAQLTASMWGYIASRFTNKRIRLAIGVGLFLIGFSRIYLGVHFPSDILAGWAVGALLLVLFLRFSESIVKALSRFRLWSVLIGFYALCALFISLYPEAHALILVAAFTGLAAGLLCEYRWIRFAVAGTVRQKILRAVLGCAMVLGLYLGLKMLLPGPESPVYTLFRFFRYWVIGLAITACVPALFVALGLADRLPDSNS